MIPELWLHSNTGRSLVDYGVWSVECGVWSMEYGLWTVDSGPDKLTSQGVACFLSDSEASVIATVIERLLGL